MDKCWATKGRILYLEQQPNLYDIGASLALKRRADSPLSALHGAPVHPPLYNWIDMQPRIYMPPNIYEHLFYHRKFLGYRRQAQTPETYTTVFNIG